MRIDRVIKSLYRRVTRKPLVPMTPEQLGELVMRDAGSADLQRLAQLHVDTFNETHVGPLGSGPTYATREWQWRDKLRELHATNFVLVLETPAKELVGFCWVHAASDDAEWGARLNKIYLRRPFQRQGLGQRMVREAVDRLLANGLTSMALFTEIDNEPACRFYENLGGQRQVGDDGKFGGMYAWPDLHILRDRLSA
jgi:ribosomal protein S18 acetylase RimI-like enzyme